MKRIIRSLEYYRSNYLRDGIMLNWAGVGFFADLNGFRADVGDSLAFCGRVKDNFGIRCRMDQGVMTP